MVSGVVIVLFFVVVIMLVFFVVVCWMIDFGFGVDDFVFVNFYFVVLIGVVGVFVCVSLICYFLVMWIGEWVVIELCFDVFVYMIQFSFFFYDSVKFGEILFWLIVDIM